MLNMTKGGELKWQDRCSCAWMRLQRNWAFLSPIVEYGVTEFIVGHYGEFDRLAAKAVIVAKQTHPEVTLSLLLPYHPVERPIEKPEGFDSTYYPPGMESVPRKLAIVRANQYVVDHVDYLIAYAWHPASNARELVEYSQKIEQAGLMKVMNLAQIALWS